MKRRLADQRGITLIEMMVVIVILGILATIIFTRVSDRPEQARRTKAAVEIRQMGTALELFKLDNGFYPTTEQGLEALVSQPSVGKIPNNYPESGYLDKVPYDPWGNTYVYICPGLHGDFDLRSYGPDAEEGGEGKNRDVDSWNLD
ncbi:MAG: type II secretion system major pseudopilin GspG [bacterium]